MRTTAKKFLSVLLSVLMVLSAVTVSFVAFAASGDEKPAKVQEFEKAYEARPAIAQAGKNNQEAAKPAEYAAEQALYAWIDTMISKYKALSDAEKDSVDIMKTQEFIKLVVLKEAVKIQKDAGKTTAPANAEKTTASAKLDEVLGTHAARTEAIALKDYLYKNPVQAPATFLTATTDFTRYPAANDVFKAYLELFKKASPVARQLAGGVYMGNGYFYFGQGNDALPITQEKDENGDVINEYIDYSKCDPSYAAAAYADICTMFYKQAIVEYPYTVTGPAAAGTKPGASASDADYKAWLDKDLAYKQWEDGKINYQADKATANMFAFLNGMDETKNVKACMELCLPAYLEYQFETKDENAVKAYEAFCKLSAFETKVYSKMGFVAYHRESVLKDPSDPRTTVNSLQAYLSMSGAGLQTASDLVFAREFNAYMETVDMDKITNDVILKTLAEYAKVPRSVTNKIAPEAMAKYNAMINVLLWKDPVHIPSLDKFEDVLANYKKTEVTYPDCPILNHPQGIDYAMDAVMQLLGGILGDTSLEGLLASGVYTNATIGMVLTLYPMIGHTYIDAGVAGVDAGPLVAGLANPDVLAAHLFEDKYATAREKLLALDTTGLKIPTDVYNAATWADGDFGFEDGDRDGFIDALLAVLRPVTKLLSKDGKVSFVSANVQMTNWLYINTSDPANPVPETGYGLYARLLPALEALGLKLADSMEYTAHFQEEYAKNVNLGYDALLKPIVESLFTDVVDPVVASPLEGLVNLLPKLGYVVGSGLLNDCVSDALGNCGGVLAGIAGGLDLSGDGLNNMLMGLLNNPEAPIKIPVGDSEITLALNLKPIDWNALANCADLLVVESNSFTNAYRIDRVADKKLTFTYVFYYLYETIFDDANYALIKDLLNSLAPDMAGTIFGITDGLKEVGKEEALCGLLCMLVDPDDLPEIIDPENPDIPKTGTLECTVVTVNSPVVAYLAKKEDEE